jgi:hypothetical protein
MASFETVTGALQNDARTDLSKAPNAASFGGKLHVERHEYVLTDAEAQADTIDICWLPTGAVVVPHLSAVACSGDPGTTLTLDIGDSSNPDRFADAIVLSAGGAAILFSSATLPLESYDPTPLTTATKIIATVDTVSTLANTRTLVFWLAYTLP